MKTFDPQSCPDGEIAQPPYFYMAPVEEDREGSDPFASAGWADHSRALARSLAAPPAPFRPRSLARTILHGHRALGSEHVGLYRSAKALLRDRERVRILDIGGGCGENYAALSRALGSDSGRLDYLVIENAQNCALGRETFRGADFATTIPAQHFDLAVLIGTLQYIPEWQALLADLRERSDRLTIARTPLRKNGPSFRVRQAICPALGASAGRKVGTATVTVIAQDELEQAMSAWHLVENRHVSDYAGHFSRLPPEYRAAAYRSMTWSRG